VRLLVFLPQNAVKIDRRGELIIFILQQVKQDHTIVTGEQKMLAIGAFGGKVRLNMGAEER
jgi:hypothetical protein